MSKAVGIDRSCDYDRSQGAGVVSSEEEWNVNVNVNAVGKPFYVQHERLFQWLVATQERAGSYLALFYYKIVCFY